MKIADPWSKLSNESSSTWVRFQLYLPLDLLSGGRSLDSFGAVVLKGWRVAKDAVGPLRCFPLIKTCLRRLRAGKTTWLPFCFPAVKEFPFPAFTSSGLPKEEPRLTRSGEAAGILIYWDWWPLVILSGGDTLDGDTMSWQPFPLMSERDSVRKLFCSLKEVIKDVTFCGFHLREKQKKGN